MKLPTKLPKNLYSFFWDIDAKKFNPGKKPYFTIQRLLEKGEVKEVKWVRRVFGDNLIRESLIRLSGWSGMTANFWASFLKIPKEAVPSLKNPTPRERTYWPGQD